MSEELEYYCIYPESKDSIYTTEHWTNQLSSGKNVTVLYEQQWRDGSFNIELSPKDKETLLTQDSIILNDHGACVEELSNGWFYECKIENKDQYNDEELNEIHKLMFYDKDNEDEYDNIEEKDFNNFEQDIMEANDWSMNDTIYEICCGFDIE
tara:strand:+ start:166 stop:624 length:459 start_codon:yes stop_codon:yes gene_type:complete